jgi:hypothetical protein
MFSRELPWLEKLEMNPSSTSDIPGILLFKINEKKNKPFINWRLHRGNDYHMLTLLEIPTQAGERQSSS